MNSHCCWTANPNLPAEGDPQRYVDNEALHALITKWFPECTTLEQLDDLQSLFIRLCAGIEEWRQPRLRMINEIMSKWASTNTLSHRSNLPIAIPLSSHAQKTNLTSTSIVLTAHRALNIPEILEGITRFLDSKSILKVRNVCSIWRATVAVVLGSQFRMAYPCPAITYGKLISSGLDWMQPDEAEILEMKQDVSDRLAESKFSCSRTSFYYPARILQAACLPEDLWMAFRSLWHLDYRFPPEWMRPMSLEAEDNRWFDLSQVVLNPYSAEIFDGRLRKQYGHIEIALHPQPDPLTRSPFFKQKCLGSLVRPMFATAPPCKGLGLYVSTSAHHYDNSYPTRLTHIHDEDGIKVDQLLDALEQQLPVIVNSWLRNVQEHRDDLANASWTTFPRRWHRTQKNWEFGDVDISPKVMIFLDSADRYPKELNMEQAVYTRFSKPRLDDRVKDWQQAFEIWNKKENAPKVLSSVSSRKRKCSSSHGSSKR